MAYRFTWDSSFVFFDFEIGQWQHVDTQHNLRLVLYLSRQEAKAFPREDASSGQLAELESVSSLKETGLVLGGPNLSLVLQLW